MPGVAKKIAGPFKIQKNASSKNGSSGERTWLRHGESQVFFGISRGKKENPQKSRAQAVQRRTRIYTHVECYQEILRNRREKSKKSEIAAWRGGIGTKGRVRAGRNSLPADGKENQRKLWESSGKDLFWTSS